MNVEPTYLVKDCKEILLCQLVTYRNNLNACLLDKLNMRGWHVFLEGAESVVVCGGESALERLG